MIRSTASTNSPMHSVAMFVVVVVMMLVSLCSKVVDAQPICTRILNDVQSNMTCDCSTDYSLRNGVIFNLDCVFNEAICINEEETYCGVPSFGTTLYRRGKQSVTTIVFDAEPLKVSGFDTTTDPEPITVQITHTAPLRLLTEPIVFESCIAKLGEETCKSCVICENKKQVKFDCTNISLGSFLSGPFYAPAFNKCLGLSDE